MTWFGAQRAFVVETFDFKTDESVIATQRDFVYRSKTWSKEIVTKKKKIVSDQHHGVNATICQNSLAPHI